ncbi:MAG TPA: LLM class flavin-dependent oxidoreductase [Acidimicrobiia bacterium]
MKIDAILPPTDLERVGGLAREAEALGFSGLLVSESRHDPFLALTLAAEHTEFLELGTRVVVAHPRSPMHLAQAGHDLQSYCGGRLTLGLGAVDRDDAEQRFGVPWSEPAARMREIVLALRAIWATWNDGLPLRFEGEFYRHTLMTPAFDPGPTGWGPPRVFLAGGDAAMAEVAGEVADGLFVTGPAREAELAEVIVPALERGLRRSGRTRAEVEVSVGLPTPPGVSADLDEAFRSRYAGLADRIAVPVC